MLLNGQRLLKKDFKNYQYLLKNFKILIKQLNVANNNSLSINSAITSFELDLAQNNIPWRVISAPNISPLPISPSVKRNSLYGLIFGIFIGLITALIRDKIDYVYHSSEDVKDSLKLPVLGEIPL